MSIKGIGVDIIEIDRFKKIIEKYGDRFLTRIFTEKEIKYCRQKFDLGAASFSARFAAKEAMLKAIGTGLRDGLNWKDMEIVNDELGKPFFNLSGKTAKVLENQKIFLSLSHSINNSTAFVIIEGEETNHDKSCF